MDRLDRIFELVSDLSATQTRELVDTLLDEMDEENFEMIRQRFFAEDESAPPS